MIFEIISFSILKIFKELLKALEYHYYSKRYSNDKTEAKRIIEE